jgi:O-antigen biosynthesis protein
MTKAFERKADLPLTATRPRLSLCMIVRDNARTIGACLTSIRPWVDEIVVVDTGSLDETPEICRHRGAKIFSFPWIDDFSAARNESLRHATGQWLFWMDSDDTINETSGRKLRELANTDHPESVLGFVLQVHCPGPDDELTVVDHVKLFRNRPEIRFEGRIHEQVLGNIRKANGVVAWTDIYVTHSGSDTSPEGKRKKVERDLRILHQDLRERPDHPFVLFNLGMTYHDVEEYETAAIWLSRSLEMSRPKESHVRKAYALLVSSLTQLGHTEAALTVNAAGLALFPLDTELLFRQGILAHQQEKLAESVGAYRRALASREERHFSSMDPALHGFKTRHNLALVLADQGKHDLAELEWRRALDERPSFHAAVRGVGRSLLAQNRPASLEAELNGWGNHPTFAREQFLLESELGTFRGQITLAKSKLERAVRTFPDDVTIRHAYCRHLFDHGEADEAHQALQELIVLAPTDGSAWHNLGLFYALQGRNAEAVKALEESMRVRPDSAETASALAEVRANHRRENTAANYADTEPTGNLDSAAAEARFGLSPCHSRREFELGTLSFFCAHPGVRAYDGLVPPAMCHICGLREQPPPVRYRDRSEVPARPRAGPCTYLGKQVGLRDCPSCRGNVRVKVFSCSHPNHHETTISECQRCSDYKLGETSERNWLASMTE